MAKLVIISMIFAVICSNFCIEVVGDPVEDKQALLDFVASIPNGRSLNWSPLTAVCGRWIGVTCNADRTRVVAVRLTGIKINGSIPHNTLSRLSALQILNLSSNGLIGPFPRDFLNLTDLTGLYLQLNSLSGPLPMDLSAWKNITDVDLSFNNLDGSIPASMSNLTQLVAVNLSNNAFSGLVPKLVLPNLQFLNFSNNNLNGTVPETLLRFGNSAFYGNDLLSLYPLAPAESPFTLSHSAAAIKSTRRMKKLSESVLLGIVVGVGAFLFIVLAIFLYFRCSKRKENNVESGKGSKDNRSPEKSVSGSKDQNNRLVFFEGCTFAFDLEDLLRASAEVLGKGSFGTTYKAALEDATIVVVKRLKDVGVGKRDFEQQMEIVGQIKHENVVGLRAYYYSKDEKLMVYDHFTNGSVFSMLHVRRDEGRVPLDWEARLKIAIGAARGIARIHMENNGKLVHGNIKSSNVFLNNRQYGCVSDLGLASMVNSIVRPMPRTAGYRAPEVVDTRKASQASDVYSFGVLLLELLTGKSPLHIMGGSDEVIHLVRWVQSVVREEWTAEVFDLELMRYPNIEEEMVEMLQISMTCVARMPERRPKMTEVVRMIEGVRRLDSTSRPSAESRSMSSTPTHVRGSGTPPTPRQG